MEDQILTKSTSDLRPSNSGVEQQNPLVHRTTILEKGISQLPETDLNSARKDLSRSTSKGNTELQKLADILTPVEINTLHKILEEFKKQPPPATLSETNREAVFDILAAISSTPERARAISSSDISPQTVARVLAEKAFVTPTGRQLAQLLMQSAASPESTPLQIESALSASEQRTLLLKDIERSARLQAESDFGKSPRSQLDPRAARITLSGLLARYPELQADPELQQAMAKTFQAAYQERFADKFNDLNFAQRAYYGFTKTWIENAQQISTFVSTVAAKATSGVSSIAGSLYATTESAVSAVGQATRAVGNVLSDPKTYTAIAGAISSGFAALTTWENYKAIGSAVAEAVSATASALSKSENWLAAGNALLSGARMAGSFAIECLTNPSKLWETTKSVAGFGYQLMESMGVVDIGYGIWKLGEGLGRAAIGQIQFGASLLANGFQFVTGQQSFDQMTENLGNSFNSSFGKAVECLGESTRALKGAVVAFGEITGLADAARCVYYLAKGDYVNAAISGGIAAVSIGAFVWSGGLSSIGVAAAKVGLTQASKAALTKVAAEGMEHLAKETAKEVFEKIVIGAGKTALKETGEAITDSSIKIAGEIALSQAVERSTQRILSKGISELAENVEKIGIKALVGPESKQLVGEIFEKHAYQSTKELLSELKVYEHVKESCSALLKTIDHKNLAVLENHLLKSGVSPDTAKATAKQLRKALQRGINDEEMVEILSRNITDEISEQIIKRSENTFKSTFSTALDGKTPIGISDELGGSIGRLQTAMKEKQILLSKQEIDELVEAGFDGCKRGIKRATREVVERAVRDAFDDFRKTHRRFLPALAFNLDVNLANKSLTHFEKNAGEDAHLADSKNIPNDDRDRHASKRSKRTSENNTILLEQTKFSDEDISTVT